MQNHYNLVQRADDAMIDALAADGIAYVPYFPLGGFTPLQSDGLKQVADELGQSPQVVALAWLLQRSPNVLLIPAPRVGRICAATSRPQVSSWTRGTWTGSMASPA